MYVTRMSDAGQIRAIDHLASLDESAATSRDQPSCGSDFQQIHSHLSNGFCTICTVQFSDPPFAGGSSVICGTGANTYEVFQFQNRSVQGKRSRGRHNAAPTSPSGRAVHETLTKFNLLPCEEEA